MAKERPFSERKWYRKDFQFISQVEYTFSSTKFTFRPSQLGYLVVRQCGA